MRSFLKRRKVARLGITLCVKLNNLLYLPAFQPQIKKEKSKPERTKPEKPKEKGKLKEKAKPKEKKAAPSGKVPRKADKNLLAQRRQEERQRQQMILEEMKKPTEDMCLGDHQVC